MRPFSCGSQAEDWMGANCDRCTKGASDTQDVCCPIQIALLDAWFGDGEITDEMAKRCGADVAHLKHYNWPCPEVEWTEAWRAEWYAKHPEEKEAK